MFGNRFFPSRYFPDRYWPPGGDVAASIPGTVRLRDRINGRVTISTSSTNIRMADALHGSVTVADEEV